MASSAIASTSAPLASSARWTDRRRRRPRDESLRRTPRSIARASASASEPPPPPAAGAAGAKQRVVITGSTKGLGLALARAFLSRGDGVFITSRDAENVRATVADLRSRFGDAAVVHGHPSNVGDASSVAALADEVVKVFGGVDLWINNAGSNGYRYENLDDADPATIAEVVTTNSLGSILCTRQAIITMKRHNDERSPGHIFNMEGAGSDGGATKKYAAYGHTKAGMAQLAKTMREELKVRLVPVRPRSRGERRSLRTSPGASLRPSLGFNPRPRRLSTPTDAFQLHPDSTPSTSRGKTSPCTPYPRAWCSPS
jgi:chlorophyll(ide) b reductase